MLKKKSIIFLFALTILTASYKAQTRLGIKGNLQITNVQHVHEESEKRIGGALGVFAQIPLGTSEKHYFKPELILSQQGERNGGVYEKDFYQTYINIPLMYKYYFLNFIQKEYLEACLGV